MEGLFTPSAHVEFHEFEKDVALVPGVAAIAHAAVAGDGTLTIAGLKRGRYWAIVDANPPILVQVRGETVSRVSEDGRAPRRSRLTPPAAPVATVDAGFVSGPRTTANARPKPSVIERAKAAVKRGKPS